jgi:hypothetical protein
VRRPGGQKRAQEQLDFLGESVGQGPDELDELPHVAQGASVAEQDEPGRERNQPACRPADRHPACLALLDEGDRVAFWLTNTYAIWILVVCMLYRPVPSARPALARS